MRQVGLHHDPRLGRIGDVHAGEILGRALVREPQHAPAAARELQRHALAHAAEAVERVLREKLHVGLHGR